MMTGVIYPGNHDAKSSLQGVRQGGCDWNWCLELYRVWRDPIPHTFYPPTGRM